MKVLHILFFLLLISCNTRQKVKNSEKTKLKIEQNSITENLSDSVVNRQMNTQIIDSMKLNQRLYSLSENQSYLQNFTLKNNGQNFENSLVRFVIISDEKGNKTQIPITDNSELIFNNNLEIRKNEADLKTEIEQFSKENTELKEENRHLQNSLNKDEKSLSELSQEKSSETQTKGPSLWLSIVIAIVLFLSLTKKK